ncbi:MAG: UvrD-helicase domain-containing protein [Clostridia bacterium]|nr:UvrD-helicase domain-containing protein [Clostridia bacterium]
MSDKFYSYRDRIIKRDFKRMNDKQLEAVFSTEGPLLILAGAGSGKTTVLVNRIANITKYGSSYGTMNTYRPITDADADLLEAYYNGSVPMNFDIADLLSYNPAKPWQILAITFTNKAASELKERLNTFIGPEAADIWAGTFHSICSRILRRYGDRIGYSSHFTIYDTDDQKRVIKEVQRQLGIDDKLLSHKLILAEISHAKDRLITPEEYAKDAAADIRLAKIAQCYIEYQKQLKKSDAMDFDDMIFRTVELLQQEKDVLELYQRQFRYVHVDEYQDTNYAQYVLTSLLAGGYNNICVVGDDDQSIYSFRGATIENILNFEGNYRNAKTIRLEQNYRSTGNILDAANAVIKNNSERKGKNLWTADEEGDPIRYITAVDERSEGMYIAEQILEDVENGMQFSDHAILYRTNYQSSSIETAFTRMGIPYKIIGGRRFYDRKEIRDVIAYLTVLANPADNVKLRRIINEPKRGIGDATVNAAADIAATLGLSIYDILEAPDEYEKLSRSANKIKKFTEMIDTLRLKLYDTNMSEVFDDLLEDSGYMAYLAQDKETYEERKANVGELKSNMMRYMDENEDADLTGFLEEISLLSDIDAYNEQSDVAVLMTIHSSKGLEFPVVFLTGMEDGIFPSSRAIFEEMNVEEERRLAYVGITRARKKLYLSRAATRMQYGSTKRNPVSRFVEEIPDTFIETVNDSQYAERRTGFGAGFGGQTEIRHSNYYGDSFGQPKSDFSSAHSISAKSSQKKPAAATALSFSIGDTVSHRAFGKGVVLSVTPMGNDNLIEIAFEKAGTKKVMGNFAKLQKI